jgi:phosphatidylglycerophosphate synthase
VGSDKGKTLLDGTARRLLDPALDRLGAALARSGVTADSVTYAGFGIGLAAAGAIAFGLFALGLVLILASRLCDGLDGAVARHTVKTDRGGFLDIVLDFAFYGGVPLAFVIADPAANAVAGATLILSFYVNGATFLAYAIFAEKRKLSTVARGSKSLYFTTGLAEATETIAVFCLFCLFPAAFALLAYFFAALTLVTAAARIVLAVKVFR